MGRLGAFLGEAGPVAGFASLLQGLLEARRADLFEAAGVASTGGERRSRAQAAPAVAIYRQLLARMPQERALRAMGPLIEGGALAFLAKTLPEVSGRALEGGSETERWARVTGWVGRFFTATAEVREVAERRVVFEVHACALVRLVTAAGHPELGPLFCRGDESFFRLRGLGLARPSRIAAGGTSCRFILSREP